MLDRAERLANGGEDSRRHVFVVAQNGLKETDLSIRRRRWTTFQGHCRRAAMGDPQQIAGLIGENGTRLLHNR